MQAYRTHLIIDNPQRVTLANLPFQAGQYVEVLLLAQDERHMAAAQALKTLLKETQALPQIKALIEDDIAAYRRGQ